MDCPYTLICWTIFITALLLRIEAAVHGLSLHPNMLDYFYNCIATVSRHRATKVIDTNY